MKNKNHNTRKVGILRKNSFIFAVALLLFGILALAQELPIFTPHGGRAVLIVAHRGANKFAPQNTLPATEKAIRMNLDFVEIDVRTTKDGRLVLMHNETVDGTTDGKGAVRDLTLEEIKALDAGIRFRPKFKGTRVPTLEEYFAAAKGRINTYLDWKDASPEALADAIIKAGVIDSVLIYDGSPEALRTLKKIDPGFHVMPEADSEIILKAIVSSKLKCDAIASNALAFTPKIAELAHKMGVKTFVDILGVADNCAGVKKQISYGADAIQTDNPDMVLKCLKPKKDADSKNQ
jgi:glycerophosphoryl diester phosphodiesterase